MIPQGRGMALDVRLAAREWLSEFSPLLDLDEGADEATIATSADIARRLQQTGTTLYHEFVRVAQPADFELLQTLNAAVQQVQGVEADLRVRLARATGRPSVVDLDLQRLRERLSDRQARQEIGLETEEALPRVLEFPVAEANYAAAGMLGIFALGWNSFTLFHAVMMIGGMSKAFGPGAFALIFFYLIFFSVGFAMFVGCFTSMTKEEIRIDGSKIWIRRTTLGYVREHEYELSLDQPASFHHPSDSDTRSTGIMIKLADGKKKVILTNLSPDEKTAAARRINAYCKTQKSVSYSGLTLP